MIRILTLTIATLRMLTSVLIAYALCVYKFSLFETVIYACLLITSVMLGIAELVEYKYSKKMSDSND